MGEHFKELAARATWQAALAELVGTGFLTLVALLAGTPYAVALTLAALVYAIGAVSGCHINPAVTLGLAAARRLSLGKALVYLVAQVIGALVAGQLSFLIGNPSPDYHAGRPMGEFVGAGLLLFTVAAVSDKWVPQAGSGIAIGAALAAGLATTGGILNPAVAIAMSETRSPAVWATVLGGIVFTGVFSLLAAKNEAKKGPETESAPAKAPRPEDASALSLESGAAD